MLATFPVVEGVDRAQDLLGIVFVVVVLFTLHPGSRPAGRVTNLSEQHAQGLGRSRPSCSAPR
ncbi:hypothetical protein [Streptomyces viridochromogenes]|uniref:Uncharacterized protein n=1 Tax=Streptomyces viridochromogenes Tue57 TaxID=1160705 RepID=L8PNQ5_STRVR|nr:hypothetical protein [Streptomyces viridochromogenes]ELS57653.1 hypothetical protein STVIR_1391 [Streptomyces viridochromogenes Tue57]